MPIYEFRCKTCEKTEEFLLKFSEAKPTKCTACGGEITQLISQTSFALKGSGWYVTDYKAQPKETSDGKPAAAADSKTEVKTAESTPPAPATAATPPPAPTATP